MKNRWIQKILLSSGTMLIAGMLFLGCEIDSAETSSRNVNIAVAGFYTNPNGGPMVQQNSGNPVSTLDLRQSGDKLEAIDNNGNIFKGTIGQTDGSTASFTLEGMTTAGAKATAAGTITKPGDTKAEMRGTWIEPTLYSTIYGTATVPSNSVPDNGSSTNGSPTGAVALAISPSSVTLNSNGEQQDFSAVGGSGSGYVWTIDDGNKGKFGGVSTGSSVTYRRITAGENKITVTDSASDTDTATIIQP